MKKSLLMVLGFAAVMFVSSCRNAETTEAPAVEEAAPAVEEAAPAVEEAATEAAPVDTTAAPAQ